MKLHDQNEVGKSVRVGTKHYLVRNDPMYKTMDVVRDLYLSHPLNGSRWYTNLMELHWNVLALIQSGFVRPVELQVKVQIFEEDVGRLCHRVLCSLEVR